ncbi:MAG: hypothetical protein K6G00_11605 [Treponema sp.]|nr:hypothetical protein [Treponema sp.]
MATSSEKREEFNEKAKPIKDAIKAVLAKEKNDVSEAKKNPDGIAYKKLMLADQMIYLATLYMAVNTLSVQILDFKNNDSLNDARKTIYKALIYLEEVVSNTVDCSYSDLEDKLAAIADINIEKRFYLVRKLGLVIDMLVEAFGDNSKWKMSFVEIRGRFIVIAKNMIDMKKACKDYYDPNSPDYENSILYIRLIRKLLDKSADEYRDKYELAGNRMDDMQMGINLLIAARRVAMVLGDKDASEEIKRKAIVWKNKLDADTKKSGSKK